MDTIWPPSDSQHRCESTGAHVQPHGGEVELMQDKEQKTAQGGGRCSTRGPQVLIEC